jgi:lysophospholipase L1-like esterase
MIPAMNSFILIHLIFYFLIALPMNRNTQTSQLQLGESETIVFLGDSITELGMQLDGYVTLVANSIEKVHPDRDIRIIGAGISGHKVPDCLERLDRDVLQRKPTLVVIYIGINDVWHWNVNKGTEIGVFESGLREMTERITSAGARVVLCTPTVIGEKTDGTNEFDRMLEEYSNVTRTVASETGSTLLDLRKAFLQHLETHNTMNAASGILTYDSVHLNGDGNRFLAGLVLDTFGIPHGYSSSD